MLNNAIFSLEEIEQIKNSKNEEIKELSAKIIENPTNFNELAFAYYYTNDEKYWEKAHQMILDKISTARWENHEFGSSDLGTASECLTMATAYSLFGDKLTEEEKNLLLDHTYNRGIYPIFRDWVLPSEKQHAIDTMGHNWWLVCVSSGAMGALILKDEIPECERLYKMADRGIEQWFKYKGNPLNYKPQNMDNGAFYEGIGYLNYPLREYLQYAVAHKNLVGTSPFNDEEIITANSEFFITCTYFADNNDYYVDFGDTHDRGGIESIIYLVRYGVNLPKLRWYVKNSLASYDNLMKALTYNVIYEKEEQKPEALSVCYDKIGWAVFRDSFDKNGTMLAVKCGDTWNHAHADSAHFTLYHNGEKVIYDSLTTSYSRKVYIGYYVESEAHNVLLFNGKGQDVRDNYKNHAHCPGKLLNYMDEDGFRYVVAEGTGPMSRYFRKHHRHFLWLDKFIFIYDDVECYENGEVNFLLHATANNPLKMLTPATVTEHIGYLKNKDAQDYIEMYKSYNRKTDDEGHVKFISVIPLDGSVDPVYEEIENGYKITCGNTKVYVNTRSDGKVMHKNCISTLDGITTDAMILVDHNSRYAVANGSIVRKDGVSHLDTWVRMTGWVDTAEKIEQ